LNLHESLAQHHISLRVWLQLDELHVTARIRVFVVVVLQKYVRHGDLCRQAQPKSVSRSALSFSTRKPRCPNKQYSA
jgi:hypothetical protein